MKKIDCEGSKRYFDFSTWDDFIAYVRGTPRNPLVHHSAANMHGDVWNGGSMADAERFADLGWSEGALLGRKYTDRLVAMLQGMIERPTIVYDVEGAALDMGRYLEGEPECWMRFEQERAKFVRLVINVGASGAISGGTLIARGAVIIALAEVLEMSGTRCEITVVDATGDKSMRNGDIHYSASVTVKSFEQSADAASIAYAAAHPSVLRRHFFRLYETMDEAGCQAGYGAPADVAAEHRGDLYFAKMHASETWWNNETTAVAWVIEQLKKFGVTLKSA